MSVDVNNDVVMDENSLLQAGIEAGNINLNTLDDESDAHHIAIMSKEAQAAEEQHHALIQSIEQKRVAQKLRVPTDDNEVKQRLRALKEPICYFGEDAADRRDRLKEVITKMLSSGEEIPEFRRDRKQLEIDLATIADKINENRPYFTKGNPWIKVARTKILQYSMKRAAKRVGIQLKEREDPLPRNKCGDVEMISTLQSFSCQASYYNKCHGARPLTACAMSRYLKNENDSDGNYVILFGDQSGNVTVWNENGKMSEKIGAHEERITGIDIMPFLSSANDRNRQNVKFLTCGADGMAKLWNVNGDELAVYDGYKLSKKESNRQRCGKCAFHPCSAYFATTSYDRTWSFWEVEKQNVVLLRQEGHSQSVHCCAFHPDGSLIATGDLGGIVRIWDLRSGRAIWGGDSHAKSVLDVDFNVNGYIMSSCSIDNTIRIWDLRKHSEYTIPAHDNLISAAKFEPNYGKWAVSVSFDKSVRIWSMKKAKSYNFKLTKEMKGHHSRISDLCISDGGIHKDLNKQFIVTASHDKTWKIWAADDGNNVKIKENDDDNDINMKQIKTENS